MFERAYGDSRGLSSQSTAAISVRGLTKTFQVFQPRAGLRGSFLDLFKRTHRDVHAVSELSMTIAPGELVGFIGPNGAGKSTSIKMLTGILKPTAGEMEVLGFHPYLDRKHYTQHIGVVFGQRTQLWWDIAVIESLKLLAAIYNVEDSTFEKRLVELREVLGLEEILGTPVRKLSLGQRVRADLAASFIHNPQILFLDEPTIGLDTVAKESVRRFLRHMNETFGTTIILTTHDLREIEELCSRMIIVDHGKIIYDGDIQTIKSLPGLERTMVVQFADDPFNTSEIDAGEGPRIGVPERILSFDPTTVRWEPSEAGRAVLRYDAAKVPTVDLARELLSRFEVSDLAILEPDIEDVVRKIYREGLAPPNVVVPEGVLEESLGVEDSDQTGENNGRPFRAEHDE